MAKEEVSEEQKKKEEETLKECKTGWEDKKLVDKENLDKIVNAQVEALSKQLTAIPRDITAQLNDLIIMLREIVGGGIKDPNDPDADPLTLINALKALIEPIINSLTALPIPDIPGLTMLVDILNKLTEMATKFNKEDFEDKEFEWSSFKPSIPPELKAICSDLLDTIQVIMTTLPMALIGLIFDLFNAVVGCLLSIAGAIGVPSIPFPLTLIPDLIKMTPDLMKLIGNTGLQVANILKVMLKEKVEVMNQLQFPPMPNHLPRPNPKPPCPLRTDEDKKEESAKEESINTETPKEEDK